ncbi:ABC-type molybdate transport system, periplasmic component [Acidovorax sp. CF316]|uniref:molybdate ABC transporter substrate-binding protein n=1 Tax=Acidovorax sp. CF316 TaxID=1144317 RepID=UPI00026BCB0D|nr:molybdate ABC transporter substrate-binding protein [Acidovorax sp. CF316]EJE52994.1 ABC-type molybdate transport system, periplasmic component [Acidovorax sp. CF316]
MHRWMPRALAAGAMLAMAGCASPPAEPAAAPAALQVYAAGSLREVFTEVAAAHQARTGQPVELSFGASGLLRERIEQGAPAQVFASADTQHPARLAARGGWQAPVVFVRNGLCALAAEQVRTTPATLLATLLRPDIRLGTSTPLADPSGDYAWELFRRAEAVQPGAFAVLEAKALQLTGGASSPKPPAGRGTYAWVMEQGQADVFLTYCTNAIASQRELPRLQVVQVPPALQVGAAYGVSVRSGAPPAAHAFVRALLSESAQAVFKRMGFAAP